MSATTVVDLFNSVQCQASISAVNGVASSPSSGVIVGQIVDMLNANNYCNVWVQGGPSSGPFQVQIQQSDSTTSGSFTDPMSGFASLPGQWLSGGVAWFNSGLWSSGSQFGRPNGPNVNNAPLYCSGNMTGAAFQRSARYVRAIIMSGNQFDAPVSVGFLSQAKTIGSGAGFSYSPSSGVVNV